MVPDTLHDVDFMVRTARDLPTAANWGYAEFDYDAASDTFKPLGTGSNCGYACHTIVKAKDYVFTAFPKRLNVSSETTCQASPLSLPTHGGRNEQHTDEE
jgi:hypothetical protein